MARRNRRRKPKLPTSPRSSRLSTVSTLSTLSAGPVADRVLEPSETSVLDLLDRLLEKGVMANGDVMLGVAGVDLIYVRLAALLCAADRVLPRDPRAPEGKSWKSWKLRHRRPGGLRLR
jgi:hypothetical protein